MTGSTKGLVAFLLTALLVAPVVLVGCGVGSPEGAVREYFKAWQDMDWEAFKAAHAPQKRNLTKDQEELAKQKFEQIQVKSEGLKMETTYSKEDKKRATVVVVEGKISYTAMILGEKKTDTQDVGKMDKDNRPKYNTIEVDGVWYIDEELG